MDELKFEYKTEPYKQYSSRVVGILVLVFILFFGLLLFQNVLFLFYIVPAILLVFISYETVENQQFEITDLLITRSVSKTRIIESDELIVSFEVYNPSNFDSHQLELLDLLPPEFKVVSGVNKFLFSLKAGQTETLSYTISSSHLGYYTLNSVDLIHKDWLGMNSQIVTLTSKKDYRKALTQQITVVPRLEKVETMPVLPQWLKFYNGNFTSNQIGFDSDFQSIRNYQYGDTLRRINWKTTAKHGMMHIDSSINPKLFTNNYSVDKSLEAEIVFDLSFSAGSIWLESIRQVTTLTEFLIRYRNKVGLTVLNQFPDYIRPKPGKRQLKSIIDKILVTKVDSVKNDSLLFERLAYIANKYDRNAVVIIISPFLTEYVFKLAKLLKSRHMKLLAITPLALHEQINNIHTSQLGTFSINNPIEDKLTAFTLALKEKETETWLKKERIFQIKWIPSQPVDKSLRNVRITY